MQEIKTIYNVENNNKLVRLEDEYKYQKDLTDKLDLIQSKFDQSIINEIVLWKVNRYVKITDEALLLLNKINRNDSVINIDLTKEILQNLLNTPGIRIALASTILRFKNPDIYQIIDQRVYRFIHPYGEELKNSTDRNKQISLYLEYLERLHKVCLTNNIPFRDSDRILYIMDKEFNKDNKLK
ncbi:MAG TPA: hypothetical protein PLS61_02790 [Candidatus Portnoybacteria bacterium]|nr:hypothetical protein [Candidatus Portnoybacteria bacterium]